MDIKIKSELITRISNQLNTKLFLFTGAGFSVDCKNIKDSGMPIGNQLAERIYFHIFNKELPEGSTLKDVYQACLNKSKIKTIKFIEETLTISYNSIKDYYHHYCIFPWKGVYTLNQDNFWEASYNKFHYERKFETIAGNTNSVSQQRGINDLLIIHLNGKLENIPDNAIFSDEDYSLALGKENWGYSNFAADYASNPFIFIGTQLDESILWKYVVLRKLKGNEHGVKELRPLSYIVIPKLNEVKKMVLSEYNIQHIPMTAEQFSNEILNEIKDKSLNIYTKLVTSYSNYNIINNVSDLISQKDNQSPRAYLNGSSPIWKYLLDGAVAERDFENQFYLKIKEGGAFVIQGTAGDGKTSTAMRIASKINSENLKVGWLDASENPKINTIISELQRSENYDYLFIDSAKQINTRGRNLCNLIETILNDTGLTSIVFIIRSSQYDKIFYNFNEEVKLHNLYIKNLNDSDIKNIIDILTKFDMLGKLKGLSEYDQFEIFRKRSKRQLLVAMMEATKGKDFNNIVVDEFQDLPEIDRNVYCLVSVATTSILPLRKEEIVIALQRNNDPNPILTSINKLTSGGLLISNNDIYLSRHRLISQVVTNYLINQNHILFFINCLTTMSALRVNKTSANETRRLKKILRFCLNHNYLQKLHLENSVIDNFYESNRELLNEDFDYWLQRGSFELETDRLDFASNSFSYAHSIFPTNILLQTEMAYLETKEAIANPGNKDSEGKIKKAFEDLNQIIEKDTEANYKVNHIYLNQALKWASVGIKNKQKRIQFLESLRKRSSDVIGNYSDGPLLELHRKIEKEYLELAL